jgi:hypothetical protein
MCLLATTRTPSCLLLTFFHTNFTLIRLDNIKMAPKTATTSNKTATTPKKAIVSPGRVKRAPVVGPIRFIPKWMNKVYTASTQADGVFVTWAVRAGDGTASFVRPLTAYFEQGCNSSKRTDELKVTAIMPRRDFHNLEDNVELPSSNDASWDWDSFVTVATAEDDTAVTIGEHITDVFNRHDTGKKPKFLFCGEVSDAKAGLKPLSYYLLDEDVAQVFKSMYASSNEKDVMMDQSDILEGFFGSAEKGREVLERTSWDASA